MSEQRHSRRVVVGSVALAVVSLSVAVGVVIGVTSQEETPLSTMTQAINASSTHGVSNFALATGALDENVEAIYFLDYLTGTLRAAAISQNTQKFAAFYKREILKDFGADELKNPRFLIVTGKARLRQAASRTNLANSLVYVMEVNSGQIIAYALPEPRGRRQLDQMFKAEIAMVDKLEFRGGTEVRDSEEE